MEFAHKSHWILPKVITETGKSFIWKSQVLEFVHEEAEPSRVHNLTHLHTSKGLRFKSASLILKFAKLLNFLELVSDIKFTSSLLIEQEKLESRKFFLNLNFINKFTGNVKI